jgi:monothiol glutaredoxin
MNDSVGLLVSIGHGPLHHDPILGHLHEIETHRPRPTARWVESALGADARFFHAPPYTTVIRAPALTGLGWCLISTRMDDPTREQIQSVIDQNDIVLFMKGTPATPQCGFSARLVSMLDSLAPKYASVNVLADASIRQGIKEFSDWPTIPQLYVKGEFIGGCDIVTEMFESGELEDKLGVKLAEVEAPSVTVSERALKAFREAVQGDGEFVRLEVDARFNHGLSVGPKQGKDVAVEVSGLTILLDRASAKRAQGLSIDFVDGADGPAFKIDNPNEPPKVKSITPGELKKKLDAGEPLQLWDVRTPAERARAEIGGRLLDRDGQQEVMKLAKDTQLVFYCHHGARSLQAAEFFLSHGFSNVSSLTGGIDSWSETIDPSVPRY